MMIGWLAKLGLLDIECRLCNQLTLIFISDESEALGNHECEALGNHECDFKE